MHQSSGDRQEEFWQSHSVRSDLSKRNNFTPRLIPAASSSTYSTHVSQEHQSNHSRFAIPKPFNRKYWASQGSDSSRSELFEPITVDFITREVVTQGHSLHNLPFRRPYASDVQTPGLMPEEEAFFYTGPSETQWPRLDVQPLEEIFIPAWRRRHKQDRAETPALHISGRPLRLNKQAATPLHIDRDATPNSPKPISPSSVCGATPEAWDKMSQIPSPPIVRSKVCPVPGKPGTSPWSTLRLPSALQLAPPSPECEDKVMTCAVGTGKFLGNFLYAAVAATGAFVSGLSNALVANEGETQLLRRSWHSAVSGSKRISSDTSGFCGGLRDCLRNLQASSPEAEQEMRVESGRQYVEWRCLPGWQVEGLPPPMPMDFHEGLGADEFEAFVQEEEAAPPWVYVTNQDSHKQPPFSKEEHESVSQASPSQPVMSPSSTDQQST
eukprot:Gregarina_sp_Poly_1__4457@NODE_239_length_10907_cov_182_631458_g210_i0_p3_GENE_NODE_239_length_10907_cov_182_631458_g210_i0NODE_239_length_10907_cov_182_631458_g210_i0_p3_ORF_typecomplete_len439_score88_25_NODE_239_length_10907_cov_182_631458_g210_i081369452